MNEHYNKNSLEISKDSFDIIEKTQIRFIKSKKRVQNFIKFYSSDQNDKKIINDNTLRNVSDCGSWLEFRNYVQVDKTKLHNANFCKKDKLCPACAMRRASKQVQKVFDYIHYSPDLLNKNWYYIVLPVKHNVYEDFETVFNRAKDGLKSLKIAIDNNKRGKGRKSFFSQFDGFLYSFEVTKTKNGWNNHINLLCCADQEIKGIYKKGKTSVHNGIMKDWAKFTDNKSYVHSINKVDISTKDSLIKNLLEIFKYSLKFQDLSNQDLLEVYEKTYRKRLLGGLGSLYNLKFDLTLKEDDDKTLGNEYLQIIYHFNYGKNFYELYKQDFVIDKSKEIKKKKQLAPVHKTRNKVVNVKVFDKNSNISKNVQIFNYKNITDFEIYAHSLRLYELKKSANYQAR